MVDQVVGRLVRLVVVDPEGARSGGARLLGASQADEARVKLCSDSAMKTPVSAELNTCIAAAMRTLDVVSHLLDAVALGVD